MFKIMTAKAPPLLLPNQGTLLDSAVTYAKDHPEIFNNTKDIERTLLVVGSEAVGKTKLTIKILDLENEELLPTLLLGYLCATKDAVIEGEGSRTCHAWELAGIGMYASVLDIIRDIPGLSAVLVVDLSSPQFLWHTVNSVLNVVLEFLSKRGDIQQMQQDRKQTLPEDYPDLASVTPFPVPLAIVGGKYDVFQTFEPEKKKIITKMLRYLAHTNCAYLLYFGDTKDNGRLSKRTKDVLQHFAFGTDKYDGPTIEDYNSPIIIPPGKDSFGKIDPSFGESHSLSKYLHMLELHFPQEDPVNFQLPDDPTTNENFKEPSIDALRRQKDEEFALDRKEKARKQKLIEDLGLEEEEESLSAKEESLKWNFNY